MKKLRITLVICILLGVMLLSSGCMVNKGVTDQKSINDSSSGTSFSVQTPIEGTLAQTRKNLRTRKLITIGKIEDFYTVKYDSVTRICYLVSENDASDHSICPYLDGGGHAYQYLNGELIELDMG